MKRVFLVHHVDALQPVQDPQRHASQKGREQAARLGMRLNAMYVAPVRILHSELQYTRDTAAGIAEKLAALDKVAQAAYPINTGDPIAPFLSEIDACIGDIMMCGHVDYLLRTVSQLVCGNEKCKVMEFKPGNGTLVCLEGEGKEWVISFMWRQDHAPG